MDSAAAALAAIGGAAERRASVRASVAAASKEFSETEAQQRQRKEQAQLWIEAVLHKRLVVPGAATLRDALKDGQAQLAKSVTIA